MNSDDLDLPYFYELFWGQNLSIEDKIKGLTLFLPHQECIRHFVHTNPLHNLEAVGFAESLAMREYLLQIMNVNFSDFFSQVSRSCMIQVCSSYFDRGISRIKIPRQKHGLYSTIYRLIDSGYFPFTPLSKASISYRDCDADLCHIVSTLLDHMVDASDSAFVLLRSFMLLPGWASYCIQKLREEFQNSLIHPALDYLAAFLLIEYANRITLKSAPLKQARKLPVTTLSSFLKDIEHRSNEINQEQALREGGFDTSKVIGWVSRSTPKKYAYQALFCIDDRNFSIRKIIEDCNPSIKTYGVAGFFNVDAFFQCSLGSKLSKQCPPAAHPQHIVSYRYHHKSRILPGLFKTRRRLDLSKTSIQVEALSDHPKYFDKMQVGYTVEEASQRVAMLFKTIDIGSEFSPVVCVIAHGSSSENNPYFAAYDCGACSGRPGFLNALSFCVWANDPRVRSTLQALHGICVPEKTVFIPFLYDTASDSIEQVKSGDESFAVNNAAQEFCEITSLARKRNALRRCSQFQLSPLNSSVEDAYKHVLKRSLDPFEPRVEYNHANNAALLIGEFDLQSIAQGEGHQYFLQSYNHRKDPRGEILERVLTAILPVCSGINLEYLFSTLDNEGFGAGNKLPHNVVGLMGVMTGMESDLRTGLPLQMIEIHVPVRLLCIVDQDIDVVQSIVYKSRDLLNLIKGQWIRMIARSSVDNTWKYLS